jgi:predicted nucleic acid-binding protein
MSRIYLDANAIIYLVEAVDPFHAAVAAKLLSHRTNPDSRIITSRLSRL